MWFFYIPFLILHCSLEENQMKINNLNPNPYWATVFFAVLALCDPVWKVLCQSITLKYPLEILSLHWLFLISCSYWGCTGENSERLLLRCFWALFTATCWSEGPLQWHERVFCVLNELLFTRSKMSTFVWMGVGARNAHWVFLLLCLCSLSCKMGVVTNKHPSWAPAAFYICKGLISGCILASFLPLCGVKYIWPQGYEKYNNNKQPGRRDQPLV